MLKHFFIFSLLFLFINSCNESNVLLEEISQSGDTNTQACDEAITAMNVAAQAYVQSTAVNFTENCMAYQDAINNVITNCGDPNGVYAAILLTLGDCNALDPCELATTATEVARLAYEQATDFTYTTICNSYKAALNNQITECGDPAGELQAIIDDLGDCILTPAIGDITFDAGGVSYDFDFTTTTINAGTRIINGEDLINDAVCVIETQVNAVGMDVIDYFTVTIAGVEHSYNAGGMPPFTSQITVNNAAGMEGTFSGAFTLQNAMPGIITTNGMIDVTY